MKKLICVILALSLLSLAGCAFGSGAAVSPSAACTASPGPTAEEDATATPRPWADLYSTPVPTEAPDIRADVSALFGGYGWTVTGFLSAGRITLPQSLVTNVADPPSQLFWMRAVVLSDDISYPLENEMGKSVMAEIYTLAGEVPEKYPYPAFQTIRGIVLLDGDGAIVGAFIDSGRHTGNAVSLSGRDVADITGLNFSDYWHENYWDADDPVNIGAENRTIEDLIRAYIQSVVSGDPAAQYATLSVRAKFHSLYANLDDSLLYNAPPLLYCYLESAEITSIEEAYLHPGGGTAYDVAMNCKISEEGQFVLSDIDHMTRTIVVGEEDGCLRVFQDGTG